MRLRDRLGVALQAFRGVPDLRAQLDAAEDKLKHANQSLKRANQALEQSSYECFLLHDEMECQRRYEIVRKRRRNFVVFRRQGGDKIKRFLAQKECSRFAVSGA